MDVLPSKPSRFHPWCFPALAFLLAILFPLLACPFEDAPFNDDFAYARMARSVALAGTYQYDLWVAPIVGPQAYYGAFFIKLFGPSHLVLRLSTLFLAGLSSLLLYHLARLATLTRPLALQVALGCTLSPIVIPLSASFMTDVPAQFLALVAITLAFYALNRRSTFLAILFLLITYFAGMVRQTNWTLIVGVAPAIILLTQLPRPKRLLWIALSILTFLAILQINHQHDTAPYALSYSFGTMFTSLLHAPLADLQFKTFAATHSALLVFLPCVAALLPFARRLSVRIVATAALLLGAVTLLLSLQHQISRNFDANLGNFLTPQGLLGADTDLPGGRNLLAPQPLITAFAIARWCLLSLLVSAAFWSAGHFRPRRALTANLPLLLLALFALPTLALTLLRTLSAVSFDRYYMPCLPFVFLLAALLQLRLGNPVGTRAVWLTLLLAALVGTALTFDYHALLRARLAAADQARALQIPRNQIALGFELDMEQQLAEWGIANNGVIKFRKNPDWPSAPNNIFWSWPFAPAINPQFVVTRSPLPGYDPLPVAKIDYPQLFPPFTRTLLMQHATHPEIPPFFPAPPIPDPRPYSQVQNAR